MNTFKISRIYIFVGDDIRFLSTTSKDDADKKKDSSLFRNQFLKVLHVIQIK
jgi:hypothetical protein